MYIRIKIFTLFISISGLFCLGETAFAQNPLKRFDFNRPRQKSLTIPFKLVNNLIVLPVRINNSDTLNFILDTGISTTMITELNDNDSLTMNIAREIELKGLGVGEPLKGLHSYGNEIRIKGITGKNQDIYIISDNIFRLSARMGMPIQGILGYSVFNNFIVSINYETKVITFYKPDRFSYTKKHSRYITLPLILENTKPYLNLKIVDNSGKEHDVKLLIDTGASHAIWLDQRSIPGFEIPGGSKETYLGTGLSGEVYGFLGRLPTLEMNGSKIDDIIVSFPDSASISSASGLNNRNGSLGTEILKRYNIIIDYPNQKFSIKPNSNFKKEFTQNLSGMEIIAPYNNVKIFEVETVRKNSPAELCGIMKGDIIRSINGTPVEKIGLSDIYLILQNQPGKKVSISYFRDGELKSATLVLEKFI